jgi:N-acetyl-anhydromuramyl-L-alanine amidase AmpD
MSRPEDQSMRDEMDAAAAELMVAIEPRYCPEYPGATWFPSPNFTPGRRSAVDLVVLHITDGQEQLHRAANHLAKPGGKVSAHFLIGRDGEVLQLVSLRDTAWHARGVNGHSVGIEHMARTPGELSPGDPGLPLTEAQLAASAQLVRWLCARFGLPLDQQHVIGHCKVPGTTHTDCGRDVEAGGIWPWAEYRQRLTPGA